MNKIRNIKPIFDLDNKLDNTDIYLDEGKIKNSDGAIDITVCNGLSDIVCQSVKPITLDDFREYISLINLDGFIAINKVSNNILAKCIGKDLNDNLVVSLYDGSDVKQINYNSQEPLFQEVIDRINLLKSKYVGVPEDGLSHQIHTNQNVSDYIIFDDCKSEGVPKKILISEENRVIQYKILNSDRDVKYKDDTADRGIEFLSQCYKTIIQYIDNITDDRFGTYIDLDIVLTKKYVDYDDSVSYRTYNINKKIHLYDEVNVSNIELSRKESTIYGILYYDGSQDSDLNIVYREDEDHEYTVCNTYSEMIRYKVLQAVFDIHKLVLYCLDPDVTEYYISSCIVNKVIENE